MGGGLYLTGSADRCVYAIWSWMDAAGSPV